MPLKTSRSTLFFVLCLALSARAQTDCTTQQPGIPDPGAIIATWQDVDYTGPSVVAHCGQRYNVFVPQGTAPPEGWPVLVMLDLGGFRQSKRYNFVDPDNLRIPLAHKAVTNQVMPMVVVHASSTVSRGGGSGNQVDDPDYDPWAAPPRYGPAYFGNGVFLPPGEIPPGYSGTGEPYVDRTRPMAEKDAVMIVQHLKHHAHSFPPGAGASAIQLDLSRMVLYGDSAGAMAWMWVALGPDRAAQTFPHAPPGSQEEQSTRVPAAALHAGPILFRHLFQNGLLDGTPTGVHLPLTQGMAGTVYDTPAQLLGDNPNQEYQDDASALVYADDGQSSQLAELNARMPLLLSYSDPSSVAPPLCFDVDPDTGRPSPCWFDTGVEHNVHSSWHGHAWKVRRANTFLMTKLSASYDRKGFLLTDPNQADRLSDRVLPDTAGLAEFADAQLEWMAELFLGAAGTWADLGQASIGTYGPPTLAAYGSLKPQSGVTLVHSNARENSCVGVIIGFTRVDHPFLSGTLVPFPDLVHLEIPSTDHAGRLVVSSMWPAGFPSGTKLYFQSWIEDPNAGFGWAATNAWEATAP